MTPNQALSLSSFVLEEQEWIPGYKAPFLFWVGMTGAVGFLALGSLWLYHHNKSRGV